MVVRNAENEVGIMQGRLSPPEGGRIQSFPSETWEREFEIAAEVGLSCIEWIYETETESKNPLGTDAGTKEILKVARGSGVAVRSVCADYYMLERLVGQDGSVNATAVHHLRGLLERVGALGAAHIVLPFVDSSSLADVSQLHGLLRLLDAVLPDADAAEVELHLETDLGPVRLAKILSKGAHSRLKVNYDTGNSASLGYDPEVELEQVGAHLGSVHIKDRIPGGPTVRLGEGGVDFPTCFRIFHQMGYERPYILQTARDQTISEAELATRNIAFIQANVQMGMIGNGDQNSGPRAD